MELTNSKLSNYVLFSNKNLEKLCRSLINESSNAVLLETYSDKLLMADHNSGSIYFADYNFDGKTLVIENYEPVDVIKDYSKLNEAVNNYFDDDGFDVSSIVEAYEEDSEAQNTDLSESITEALSSKNMKDVMDYTQLYGINEEIEDIKNMSFFQNYTEYLTEAPTSKIKMFDWVNPVRVTLEDADEYRTIVSGAKGRAETLAKNKEFRAFFEEAADDLMRGFSDTMTNLLSENSAILSLDNNEWKEFVGLSIVGNKQLMESRKDLLMKVEDLINEDSYLYDTKEMLMEEDDDGAETTDEDKALETSDKDINALKTALDKALENITDEKLVSKINSLKDALDASKDEGTTDVGTVKECVELLNL